MSKKAWKEKNAMKYKHNVKKEKAQSGLKRQDSSASRNTASHFEFKRND